MSRRLRIALLGSAITLVVLLASALMLVYAMLRPERFTRTLQASARQAGLTLTLTSPARPSLWPRPGVRLDGLQLYVSGHAYPLLIAKRGRIVVPWRTLLGSGADIATLQLDTPRLDLDQLRSALAALPASSSSAPDLPHIGTGVTIIDGALIHNNRVLLDHLELHTGSLLPGHVFTLDAAARDTDKHKRLLKLQFTPQRARDGSILLNDLGLQARAGSRGALELGGTAQWMGGPRFRLDVSGRWTTQSGAPYRIAMSSEPVPGAPLTLEFKVDGKDVAADLRLSPTQLSAWWRHMAGAYVPGPLPLPPMDGSVDAKELKVGDLEVKGLKLRSGDAMPATAASSGKGASGGAGP